MTKKATILVGKDRFLQVFDKGQRFGWSNPDPKKTPPMPQPFSLPLPRYDGYPILLLGFSVLDYTKDYSSFTLESNLRLLLLLLLLLTLPILLYLLSLLTLLLLSLLTLSFTLSLLIRALYLLTLSLLYRLLFVYSLSYSFFYSISYSY